MFKVTGALLLLALAALGWQPRTQRSSFPPGRLHGEALLIEYDATSGEAVLKAEAESDEELVSVAILDPDGRTAFELQTQHDRPEVQRAQASRAGRGRRLTGFSLELCEPGLEALLATHPEGLYEFRACTADGRVVIGEAQLSHELLPAPVVLHPSSSAMVSPGMNRSVLWASDGPAKGYRVHLEQREDDELSVELPAGSSSFRIPDGLLVPGTLTQLEVGAIGRDGNCTLVEVSFTTPGSPPAR